MPAARTVGSFSPEVRTSTLRRIRSRPAAGQQFAHLEDAGLELGVARLVVLEGRDGLPNVVHALLDRPPQPKLLEDLRLRVGSGVCLQGLAPTRLGRMLHPEHAEACL